MNEAVYKIPVSTEWHEGRWNAPAVIKIQESEKQNSGERAEIPNSPEDITMPTSLRSLRILLELVTESPLGYPKGALGENRLPCNLATAVFKKRCG